MRLWSKIIKPYKELPTRFKLLNIAILLPILIWPFIFYTTIFFFDKPGNEKEALAYFILVNAYPIPVFGIFLINALILSKKRIIGSVLPIGLLLTIIIVTAKLGTSIFQTQYPKHLERETRKEAGYFSPGSEYRVIDGQIFYQDSIPTEADKNSFEELPYNWARDNKDYFYLGKTVSEIDYASFEILESYYSKDKNHVYYENEIITGADPKSFKHIDGSNDAIDKDNCYSWGENIPCNEIEK